MHNVNSNEGTECNAIECWLIFSSYSPESLQTFSWLPQSCNCVCERFVSKSLFEYPGPRGFLNHRCYKLLLSVSQKTSGTRVLFEFLQYTLWNMFMHYCFSSRWGKLTVNEGMLDDLLPGPVTLVFERTASLNPELNPGTNLVGIRIPDHDFVRRLALSCHEPLALTSANISAAKSSLIIQVGV